MPVRAKFKLDKIERILGSKYIGKNEQTGYAMYEKCEMRSITMSPVYGGNNASHENKKFWEATPSGSLILTTVNKDAVEAMDIGEEYYIDITKA